MTWSKDAVQRCPLAAPVDGTRIPVYTHPVPRAKGARMPAPRSWLTARDGAQGKEAMLICERKFAKGAWSPAALYWHPNDGWYNNWWALAIANDGKGGWVPEAFLKGGDNLEPDLGLRTCTTGSPPPKPVPPPRASPCQPLPLVAGVTLRAHFKRGRRIARPAYGHRPRIRGSLMRSAGVPMAGTTVCVGVQRRSDQPVTAVGAVTTDAKGRFSYRASAGSSRRLCFVRRIGTGAAAACVDIRVRARVTLRSSRRVLRTGEATVFRGRLGGGTDRRGLIVELQYPQHGGWQTFATARAGRHGRFAYRYRFTRTVGTFIYRLRARVPAQRGYPYVAGASRTVRVRVSG